MPYVCQNAECPQAYGACIMEENKDKYYLEKTYRQKVYADGSPVPGELGKLEEDTDMQIILCAICLKECLEIPF